MLNAAMTVLDVSVLLQHNADPNIRNADGKTAIDLADPSAKPVLTGEVVRVKELIVYNRANCQSLL